MHTKAEARANLVYSYEFGRYTELMQREMAELRALVGTMVPEPQKQPVAATEDPLSSPGNTDQRQSWAEYLQEQSSVSTKGGTLGSSPRCTRWRHYISRFMSSIRHIPGARNIMADFFSRYVLPQDLQMPITLAAITGSLMVDTDSEEKDMPILLLLAQQGAETPTDVITDILCSILLILN